MFKCSECEKIYAIKPDYCDDCGNDTFIEIVEEKTALIPDNPTPEIKKEPEIIMDEPKPAFEKPAQKPKKDIDYLSWGFLGICILISLFIIFFAWNPKIEDAPTVKNEDNSKSVAKNIPSSVNGFWNNALPKIEPKKVTSYVPKPQPTEQIQPQIIKQEAKPSVIIPKAPEIKKTVQTVQKQPQPAPKQAKTVQTVTKQTQAKTQPVQKTTVPKQTTTQQQPKTVQKPVQQQQQKPVQTTTKPVQTTTQPVWQAVQQPSQTTPKAQTVDTTALKKELSNYKINLRNTIGKKIDFANVIGDGSCTVSFKIASNGKLTNRAFAKQSTNVTLNDAVYAAVMATPSYNQPPSGYNGETLYLKISFYNGNFQITLN